MKEEAKQSYKWHRLNGFPEVWIDSVLAAGSRLATINRLLLQSKRRQGVFTRPSHVRWRSPVPKSHNNFAEFVPLGDRLAEIKNETGVDGFEPRGEKSQVDPHAVMELMATRFL